MICYYFPPLLTPGSIRAVAFAQRLPRFGWRPVVLTVSDSKNQWVTSSDQPVPPDVEVHRAPEWNLFGVAEFLQGAVARVLRVFGVDLPTAFMRQLLWIPDAQIAWSSTWSALRLAREVECVYAQCSPWSSALRACFVGRVSGKPVVLDFRDAWSFNPHEPACALRRRLDLFLERIAILRADRVIVNTPGALATYRALYPSRAECFEHIPNGYDDLNVAPAGRSRGDRFVIMHVGSFYGNRSPVELLEALREIGDPEIEFVQVGHAFDELEEWVGRVPVRCTGPLPRDEALAAMRSASLLYVKQGWEEREGVRYVAVAAKTYEYLATGLPILADAPPGDNVEVVRAYAERAYVVDTGSRADLEAAILAAKARWGMDEPRVSERFVRDFDRNELTRRLARVLDRVQDERRDGGR